MISGGDSLVPLPHLAHPPSHTPSSNPLFVLHIFLFFNVYLFLGQRETEHERGRGRERETQNRKQAPGSESSAQSPTQGSNSRTG